MNPAWSMAFATAYLAAAALAAANLRSYRRLRNEAGAFQVRWSSLYHLGFPENIAILGLGLAVFAWSLYLILHDPQFQGGYRRLLILAFALGLSPRRNAVVGSRGIVYGLRFIPWTSVRTKAYLPRRTRVLLRLLYETEPGSNRYQSLTLPLPKHIRLIRSPSSPIGRPS